MRISWALLCVAAVGCSGGPTGTAGVNGAVQGVSMAAQDAILASLVFDGARHDAVLITSYAKACDHSRDNISVPNSATLTLILSQTDASGNAVQYSPGDFPIGPAAGSQRSASALFQKYDGSCTGTLADPSDKAGSGTVTLSALDPEFADGTFDLHFPGGAHVTGGFHAALCAEPTDPSQPTCEALRTASPTSAVR